MVPMGKPGLRIVEYEMWRYRYLVLFSLGLIAAVLMLSSGAVRSLIAGAGSWSYPGAFIIGMFYTYSISSLPSAAAFFMLAQNLNPFIAAAIGGLGAMLGDFLIFRFVKSDLLPEARLLSKDLRLPRVRSRRLMHFIHKLAPFIAGFIIASPLPDEVGAALFGAIEYKTKKFLLVSWICNTLGLLAIALLGTVI